MRYLLLLPVLLLGGCGHLNISLADIRSFADRLNAGIETADSVAHMFCEPARKVGLSTKAIACVARANGTTQQVVNAALDWGAAFCANPVSKNPVQLAKNIESGVVAILNADNAGCTQ